MLRKRSIAQQFYPRAGNAGEFRCLTRLPNRLNWQQADCDGLSVRFGEDSAMTPSCARKSDKDEGAGLEQWREPYRVPPNPSRTSSLSTHCSPVSSNDSMRSRGSSRRRIPPDSRNRSADPPRGFSFRRRRAILAPLERSDRAEGSASRQQTHRAVRSRVKPVQRHGRFDPARGQVTKVRFMPLSCERKGNIGS